MSSTKQPEEVVDTLAIVELRSEYAHAIDSCDWERWASLFCDDTVWHPEGRDPQTGPEEIYEFGSTVLDTEYAYTCHEAFMPAVSIEGDTATGDWYLRLTYADYDGVAGWKLGTYLDEYRKTAEGWKFAEVRAEIDFHTGETFSYDTVADEHYEKDLVSLRQ